MKLKKALQLLKDRVFETKISYSGYTWKINITEYQFNFTTNPNEFIKMDVNLKDLLEKTFDELFKEKIEIEVPYKNDLSDIENLTSNDVRFDLRYNINDVMDSYFREVYEKTETIIIECITNIDEFCNRLIKDNLIENKGNL